MNYTEEHTQSTPPAHGMPSGDQLREMLEHWDYWRHADRFTNMEISQMRRAAAGDYNWMYDKRGNPRAGWIRLWTMKKCHIAEISDISRFKRQEIEINKEREAAGKEPIDFQMRRFWVWASVIVGLGVGGHILGLIGDALRGV